MILNILEGKPLPVYGKGLNVRDWLYVDDHSRAIWTIVEKGRGGETYNIGGENEWRNIDLVHLICEKVAVLQGKEKDTYKKLIAFVTDRPGHDLRYAIDCTKIKSELHWKQESDFSDSLEKTIVWYMENQRWIQHIKSGEYRKWIERNYENR